MFLCVCAQPRFRDGESIYYGTIGCFPLVTYEPAQRSNAVTDRVRGDMVMKPITHITRDVIREFMINQVLPAIRAKWPREDVGNPIFIQRDGFHIRLISQPPNSPDFNILDLGFFRAIQAIQYQEHAKLFKT